MSTSRIHGLDTLRALAVTLVVLHHYVLFVSREPTFGWVGEIGWVGVDLFFALSGYLIGNQIFRAVGSAEGLSLPRFYARRFLRTLPNYWVVLALYFAWPAFRGTAPLLPAWEYLTFVQNLGLKPGTAFSHSWSLAIEEQFYVVLPALALLGVWLTGALRRAIGLAWLGLGLAVVAGMVVRAWLWQDVVAGDPSMRGYYPYIYYSTFCRLDELLAGVALALLKNRHPAAWGRVVGHGNLACALGIVVSGGAFIFFLEDRYAYLQTVIGYPLLALGFALLIVAAVAPGSLLQRLRVPGAASLALWSYAVYLMHRPVSVIGARWMEQHGYGPASFVGIASSLLLSLGTGWLLYRLVETPFMRLRERYVPSHARRRVEPQAVVCST